MLSKDCPAHPLPRARLASSAVPVPSEPPLTLDPCPLHPLPGLTVLPLPSPEVPWLITRRRHEHIQASLRPRWLGPQACETCLLGFHSAWAPEARGAPFLPQGCQTQQIKTQDAWLSPDRSHLLSSKRDSLCSWTIGELGRSKALSQSRKARVADTSYSSGHG